MKRIFYGLFFLLLTQTGFAESLSSSVYELRDDYIFLLVYRASCPYCQKFTPVIHSFSEQTGIHIVGVPTTAKQLPEFEDSYPLTPELKQLLFSDGNQVRIPALFLVDLPKHRVFPVSYGYINAQQLQNRMNSLSQMIIQLNSRGNYGYH